jgi:hypothetical protein
MAPAGGTPYAPKTPSVRGRRVVDATRLCKPTTLRRGLPAIAVGALLLVSAACAGSTTGDDSTHPGVTAPPARSAADTRPTTATSRRPPTAIAADDEGAVVAGAARARPPTAQAAVVPKAGLCRPGDPLANVYHPTRLKIVDPCASVYGTVMSVRHEDDGDAHFDLAVDASLVNSYNVSAQHGWLVVELVPADEPGCTPGQPPRPATGSYDYGTCSGANLSAPHVGDRVTVTGPYVIDLHHGWMEIHPVWSISGGDTTHAAPPRLLPPATPAPTNPPPATAGLPVVYPGAFCASADIGRHGISAGGVRMICSLTSAKGVPYKGGRPRWHAG